MSEQKTVNRLYFKTSDNELHLIEAGDDVIDITDQKEARRTITRETRMIPATAVVQMVK